MSGEGYPHGLKGKEIPLVGRIISIADVFDALTIERPYKHAWDVKQAKEYMLRESGKHFEARFVELFFAPETFQKVLKIKRQYSESVAQLTSPEK